MTYTFKLSRRLAIAPHRAFICALSASLLLACGESEITSNTSFDGGPVQPAYSKRWGDTAATKPGNGRNRRPSSSPSLARIVVHPDPATLQVGSRTQFTAKGYLSDGSETAVKVRWSANGGTIDSAGLYTAGNSAGTFRVAASSAETSSLADTAAVNLTQNQADVTAIVLTPSSATLQPGDTVSLTAKARLSDGTTTAATVDYTAAGGTMDKNVYKAGSATGAFRVIARQSGGTLADTTSITIEAAEAPPPQSPTPTSGKTFFLADAESGNMNAWSLPWGVKGDGTNPAPTVSQARTRNGGWAYKYEVPTATLNPHSVMTLSGNPQTSMGSPNGRYLSGYYSVWAYLDAGYTSTGWNMLLGWMTGVTGAPSPISHVGLEVRNGALQLVYVLKNCSVGLYPCPNIPGYANNGGWYTMTSSSPAGVVPFPRNRWVHLAFYYKMSPTNGQVTVWQDGVKIIDLTAPSMNTFGGHSIEPLKNSAGDMMLQLGVYGGSKSDGTQRLYLDDFRVSDYRPLP